SGNSAQAWYCGDPGNTVGGASALAIEQISGSSAGEQRGRDGTAGRAPIYVPHEQEVPETVAEYCDGDGEDVCKRAGSNRVADRQRIHAAAEREMLLQVLPGRISGLGEGEIRNAGSPKREVGDGVLEPDVHGLAADSGAAAIERGPESRAGAGLRSIPVARVRVVRGRAARDAAQGMPKTFCDDEPGGRSAGHAGFAGDVPQPGFCKQRQLSGIRASVPAGAGLAGSDGFDDCAGARLDALRERREAVFDHGRTG